MGALGDMLTAAAGAMARGATGPRARHLMVYALGASIAVHAVLLAIQFRPFDPTRLRDRTPPLEVALVNAKSKTRPAVADILAQANLDGGGDIEPNRRATTPLPVLPKSGAIVEIAVAGAGLMPGAGSPGLMSRSGAHQDTSDAEARPAPQPVPPPSRQRV